MGTLFDTVIGKKPELNPIEWYLRDREFYDATMNPRFMNGRGYNKLTLGEHCLRRDLDIKDGYTLRIFINTKDIYYEVQTPWRSYETSSRYNASKYTTVQDIDRLLDEILRIAVG